MTRDEFSTRLHDLITAAAQDRQMTAFDVYRSVIAAAGDIEIWYTLVRMEDLKRKNRKGKKNDAK